MEADSIKETDGGMRQFRDTDILTLIPQRPPFVLVDRLEYCDPVRTVTVFRVREDHIFTEDGELQDSGIVENIAQTCAARIGWINLITSEKIRIGYIGAIRNCRILRRPKVGEVLTTTVEVLEEVFRMTLVSATVRSGEETIATSSMKIAVSGTEAQI